MPEAEEILFPVLSLHPWYADQWKVGGYDAISGKMPGDR